MQEELDQLRNLPLTNQIEHIHKYLEYIFRGEDPELYLEAVFPDLYNVYRLLQDYNNLQSLDTKKNLQDYINNNVNSLAKELRTIRKELIEPLNKKKE